MQLIAGRTGQEYNQRKGRKGAFWEDRYHATAVKADSHLLQCLVYVDLNMVRAGVVAHPAEWSFCGYSEIQNPRQRYSIIDHEGLMKLFDTKSMEKFRKTYRGFVEEALQKQGLEREARWSESIAVGNEAFVRETKERLRIRAVGREVMGDSGSYKLRESEVPYQANFDRENGDLNHENAFYWDKST
jgi:putative transposase